MHYASCILSKIKNSAFCFRYINAQSAAQLPVLLPYRLNNFCMISHHSHRPGVSSVWCWKH